jgi:hypothetical protein
MMLHMRYIFQLKLMMSVIKMCDYNAAPRTGSAR